MFQNRRSVFLFICSIVFIQALYYIVTLQIKKNNEHIIHSAFSSLSLLIYNQSSDKFNRIQNNRTSVQIITTTTTITTKLVPLNLTTHNLTLNFTTTTTPAPIPFVNASFYSSFNSTTIDFDKLSTLSPCNFSIKNNDTSIYKVEVHQKIYSYEQIEEHHASSLLPGGHGIPSNCRSEQRLAIIICYRNREQHLKMFLDNIHPFLQKQQLDYTIFVVNQHGRDQFNRAALFNVGYLEAMKLYSYDCFIFHDVDLLPEDLRNIYKCGEKPRHMSVAVDKFNYKLLYSTLFGGVTAFSRSDFIGAHGYPNVYWGWGGEDDDMYLRVVRKLKKSITRYPIEIARYKMIRTHDHTSGKANPHRHTILYSKYDYSLDGINTTNYTLNELKFYKLFTLINVTLVEESFENIRIRLRIKKKKKK